ncbi:MAG: ABC transporter permease [Geodermatophilaceae bacterium]|nr:ABC transporter permease [Geodermatophilaceae bacterium]
MIDYVRNNVELILAAFGQHIALALIPVVIGVLVALPLGYLAVRREWLYQPLVTITGVLYSIPSLALFVVLPVIIGTKVLSPLNIVVALAIYTVALLVRSVADALRSVDRNVTQAATAMGYRPLKRLFGVDLPIALPVMLAGLRVATVSNISLVSVGAIIGVGGLGSLFTRGLQLRFAEPIIVGIVLSVLLAAVCDSLIVLAQRYFTPWARVGART